MHNYPNIRYRHYKITIVTYSKYVIQSARSNPSVYIHVQYSSFNYSYKLLKYNSAIFSTQYVQLHMIENIEEINIRLIYIGWQICNICENTCRQQRCLCTTPYPLLLWLPHVLSHNPVCYTDDYFANIMQGNQLKQHNVFKQSQDKLSSI